MPRCASTKDLDVHHRHGDGGGGLRNAEVLCRRCHVAAVDAPAATPPPFEPFIRLAALVLAGDRCQCERAGGCHDDDGADATASAAGSASVFVP